MYIHICVCIYEELMGKEEKCWQIILCLEALTEIITTTSQSYDVLDETKEWTFSFQSHLQLA